MNMKLNEQDCLWAGTEQSLHLALGADTQIAERLAAGVTPDAAIESDLPELLSIQGGVGVISIKGPLTNRDSWLNSMFGITSYGMIREALVAAANNEEVKQILLDIESGGGSVSGVSDTAALISMINDKLKPVTAFTDGGMMSAAYWIGASAGNVFASSTAQVGSIGVIAMHMEQSQALKDAGINVTVIRAGKYKALANSAEPLTEAARKQVQASLDGVYKVFVQGIADARGQSYEYADAKMAQGREFLGEAAVTAGLVDGITSFDTLLSALAQKALDTNTKSINNRHSSTKGPTMTKKTALTEQEIAALSAGAPTVAAEAEAAEAAAAEAAAAEAAKIDAAAQADAQAAEAAALAEAAKAESESKIVAFLQAELKTTNDALLAAKIDLKSATDKFAESQALFEPMLEIVRKSVANMHVALGGSALNMEGQSATLVLAEHQRVSGVFSEKFKAGGVAAVDATDSKGAVLAMSDMDRARLNAVRPTAHSTK